MLDDGGGYLEFRKKATKKRTKKKKTKKINSMLE